MKLLITGATGYIGKHIVKQALGAGHTVRVSVRRLDRADELRAAVGEGALETVVLDLCADAGWDNAMLGVDALIHTASPVPVQEPDDPQEIIIPAVDGTRRAIAAAARAGVTRVVVTSSIAAVCNGLNRPAHRRFGPDDWTDVKAPGVSGYAISKTLAERTARDMVADTPLMQIATVNPGFVFGAPLDRHWQTSLLLIDRLLRGQDPLLPRFSFFRSGS